MPIEVVIYLKRYDLKNVKQVLRRPVTLLVTLYCLTIGLTYDRAGFTYKSVRNHEQKYHVFPYVLYISPYAPCKSGKLVPTLSKTFTQCTTLVGLLTGHVTLNCYEDSRRSIMPSMWRTRRDFTPLFGGMLC